MADVAKTGLGGKPGCGSEPNINDNSLSFDASRYKLQTNNNALRE